MEAITITEENKKIEFLKNIYFFHTMSDSSLRKILALCTEKTYKKGTVLFFEDMPGERFFVILSGELEIWKRFGQTDELLLGVSGAGQPIGEMALIDDCPRSATVRSRTETVLLVIEAADFSDLLLTENDISLTLLRSVTMMVRRSNQAHIDDLDRQNKELALAYSELKTTQAELVRNERLSILGRFSSLILHDIRNPLSALKSRIELLNLNRNDPDYFEQSIQKINSDISRMEMLAAEFLDYARGEIRLQMSVCELDLFFENFREIISVKLESSRIELAIVNHIEKPVIIDKDRMLRVLINAAENSCKAMPSGGHLAITASHEQQKLLIEISDTGMGMSQDVLNHIFEPFYSSSIGGGTGLGMIIIKSVVEAHQGNVSIRSIVGIGTTLRLELPVFI